MNTPEKMNRPQNYPIEKKRTGDGGVYPSTPVPCWLSIAPRNVSFAHLAHTTKTGDTCGQMHCSYREIHTSAYKGTMSQGCPINPRGYEDMNKELIESVAMD